VIIVKYDVIFTQNIYIYIYIYIYVEEWRSFILDNKSTRVVPKFSYKMVTYEKRF
jgi:hypothetical protein